jgi:hypothetical protein
LLKNEEKFKEFQNARVVGPLKSKADAWA